MVAMQKMLTQNCTWMMRVQPPPVTVMLTCLMQHDTPKHHMAQEAQIQPRYSFIQLTRVKHLPLPRVLGHLFLAIVFAFPKCHNHKDELWECLTKAIAEFEKEGSILEPGEAYLTCLLICWPHQPTRVLSEVWERDVDLGMRWFSKFEFC